MEQLWGSRGGIYQLDEYPGDYHRKLERYRAAWGTAVNIQAMVFGNMGNDCFGVAFTRNPSTGENRFMANFWSMPRARMLWPVFARRCRLPPKQWILAGRGQIAGRGNAGSICPAGRSAYPP